MSNIVSFHQGGIPARPSDLIKGLQNVNQNLQGSAGGVPFLRLLRNGRFAWGPENVEPEPDSLWAVNPYSIMHGYACWEDGELLGERMVAFHQPAPPKNELPDYGAEWQQQIAMHLQCMTGADEGMTVLYKGTSVGLRNASKKLIEEILVQAQNDPEHLVPMIALESDSYHHKKYGEIYTPQFPVVDWISIDSGQAADEPVEQEEETPAEYPQEAEEEKQAQVAASDRKVGSGRVKKGGQRRVADAPAGRGRVSEPATEPTNPRARRRRRQTS